MQQRPFLCVLRVYAVHRNPRGLEGATIECGGGFSGGVGCRQGEMVDWVWVETLGTGGDGQEWAGNGSWFCSRAR